jgi:hypothetical protein
VIERAVLHHQDDDVVDVGERLGSGELMLGAGITVAIAVTITITVAIAVTITITIAVTGIAIAVAVAVAGIAITIAVAITTGLAIGPAAAIAGRTVATSDDRGPEHRRYALQRTATRHQLTTYGVEVLLGHGDPGILTTGGRQIASAHA